jgi:hypothetical protein
VLTSLIAGLAIVLVCGLGGAAIANTDTSIPDVVVNAPRHVSGPPNSEHHAIGHRATHSRISLAPRVANPVGNHRQPGIVGGCISSFKQADRPWSGCSGSSGTLSSTCNNRGPAASLQDLFAVHGHRRECRLANQRGGLVLQQSGAEVLRVSIQPKWARPPVEAASFFLPDRMGPKAINQIVPADECPILLDEDFEDFKRTFAQSQ